jgi:hypothetical protein
MIKDNVKACRNWLIEQGVDVDVFPVHWNIHLTWKYWERYREALRKLKNAQ